MILQSSVLLAHPHGRLITRRDTRNIGMSTKVKRTYNISSEAVATVKYLAEELHVAKSQDAVVEQAIAELARRVRDTYDARLWAEAGADSSFIAESEQLDAEFARDDLLAWES